MRTLWTVFTILLLIHVLALAGFVVWLRASDRLDRDRLHRLAEMFTLTIAEEEAQEQAAHALEAQAREQALQAARLESVSDGPTTLADRLQAELQSDQIADARVERLHRDIRDLNRQLALAKQTLTKQRAQLDADRRNFDQATQRQVALQQDEDFQQTVRVYEQLKPKQAKQIFQDMMLRDKTSEVVDFLAAMKLRKSAAVLRQFKTPEEIAQATELMQRLRKRRTDPLPDTDLAPIPGSSADGSSPLLTGNRS